MSNSYVDDINVKISEKYKPPCKISMPISYSQRITLNKQMQDSRPTYDFYLERTVLGQIKEVKDHRKKIEDERKERLVLARKQFNDRIEREKHDKLEQEQAQAKLLEDSIKTEPTSEVTTQNTYLNTTTNTDRSQQNYYPQSTSQNQQNYITKNGILMPIPVSSYSENSSNILKPMPMSNANLEPSKLSTKPFNLSDFESDTSSPFDNMELKSINDLEELAQVLKSDRNTFHGNLYQNTNSYQDPLAYSNVAKNYNQLPSTTKSYTNFSQDIMQTSQGYEQNLNNSRMYDPNSVVSQSSVNYNQIPSTYSQLNTNFSSPSTTFSHYNTPYQVRSTASYVPNSVSNYSNLNGYFYNTPQVNSQLPLGLTNSSYTPYYGNVAQPSMQRSNCKSVPDLVKSVEKEIDHIHLDDTLTISGSAQEKSKHQFYKTNNVPIPTRPKSTDAVYHKTKVKDSVFNPFDRLSTDQKEICRNVSIMGFPLDRVARVCLVFGNDQKKIVDHLLALSDLLDLGFPEKQASEALTKSDNDRDKALDVLIS